MNLSSLVFSALIFISGAATTVPAIKTLSGKEQAEEIAAANEKILLTEQHQIDSVNLESSMATVLIQSRELDTSRKYASLALQGLIAADSTIINEGKLIELSAMLYKPVPCVIDSEEIYRAFTARIVAARM